MPIRLIISLTETTDPRLSDPSRLLPSKTNVYRLMEYYSSNRGKECIVIFFFKLISDKLFSDMIKNCDCESQLRELLEGCLIHSIHFSRFI